MRLGGGKMSTKHVTYMLSSICSLVLTNLVCRPPPNLAKAAGTPPPGARPRDEVRAPPGAQHSVSSKAITARQLQALVRRQGLLARRLRKATRPGSRAPFVHRPKESRGSRRGEVQ